MRLKLSGGASTLTLVACGVAAVLTANSAATQAATDTNLMPPLPEAMQPLANPTTPGSAPGGVLRGPPLAPLPDLLLDWPLAPEDRKYAALDGKKMHKDVETLTAMSRRYRDTGHPQYWGRLIGSSADAESAQWIAGRFRAAGLETRIQPFDLRPQYMPRSWSVVGSNGGQSVNIETAFPTYQSPGTKGEMDLEAVWVGTGSEADYIGRDVRGKAVFIQSMPLPGSWRHTASAEGNIVLAQKKGAAAIFVVVALPGNIRTAFYPTRTEVPTFSTGMKDGYAMRDLIAKGGTPRVKVNLDTNMVPDLKTALVWGTLPGATDETIYVIAHRDGWFDAATDNGGGVAGLLALAEYYAKIPKAQRRRTLVFVGVTGHHNGENVGGTYLLTHRDVLFPKTALLINLEHIATAQTYFLGEDIRTANTATGMLWYAGGPRRPKLQDIAVNAFRSFGVATYSAPEVASPGGEMSGLWPYVPGVQASDYNMFFQSDAETADTVPWTGLQSSVRAYAKIIDGVNKLPLSDLVRPPEPPNGVLAPLASSSTPSR